jgi:glycosyltransferase involved in cell wall biosynthesis/GT2 family glycosyltransferase
MVDGGTTERRGGDVATLRVLRLAHHAVVSAWRQRERELRALGADVRLVSSRRWNEGGTDVRLDPEGDDFVIGARTWGRHPSVFVFGPRAIWRELGRRPDLIDLHEEPNSLATAELLLLRRLRRSRAPYVVYSAQNIEKRFPVPFRWIERAALRGAAAAYVCNREAGEILRRKGLAGPALYVPLGVDVEAFTPSVRDAPAPEAVIGYVGRLEPHKGVDVLLKAVATRPDWRLELTGDGPQRSILEALAAELGIADRVRFLGHAGGAELAARYQAVDVVAVPSRPWPGWLEQFCRVAVEAMASGTPVVASRTGAIPDVVGEAGVLVDPDDPVALAGGLADALESARWTTLRAAGLARSREFTWTRVAEQHLAVYREALGDVEPRPLHVVVVAYGSADPLADCLATLGPGFAVTVVDNSSSPVTEAVVRAHGATYVDPGANIGFAAGVNRGLLEVDALPGPAADVLLLNPDALIAGDGVRTMHAQLRRSPRVAALGAAQDDPRTRRPSRVWWPFPTPRGAWLEALGLGRLRRGHDFAIGSVLLLRAEAIAELGGLDEQFFLYAEETDWQYRARRAGWGIEVADVVASHEGAGTGGDPSVREGHFYASMERYLLKHYGKRGWESFRRANIVGASLRGAVLPGSRGEAARRRAATFRRGPIATQEAAG